MCSFLPKTSSPHPLLIPHKYNLKFTVSSVFHKRPTFLVTSLTTLIKRWLSRISYER